MAVRADFKIFKAAIKNLGPVVSAGRAPRLQRGGQGFEPPPVHILEPLSRRLKGFLIKKAAGWY